MVRLTDRVSQIQLALLAVGKVRSSAAIYSCAVTFNERLP